MRRNIRLASTASYDVLTLVAATWLACGVVLLGMTPMPWRDPMLGWSPHSGCWRHPACC